MNPIDFYVPLLRRRSNAGIRVDNDGIPARTLPAQMRFKGKVQQLERLAGVFAVLLTAKTGDGN
jgi:hypothetical protein